MPTTYAIPNGRTVMDATLYTGTGSSGLVVNNADTGTQGFYPDLIWIKSRNAAYYNTLLDYPRGVAVRLFSNLADAESNNGCQSSFNTNGFTLNADAGGVNNSGTTYVAWQWNAGSGTTSSNTNGSITSTVGVNTTAGFSIVTYTGNGSTGTVGHGLGVTPAMIIVKGRNLSGSSWIVYHQNMGTTPQSLRMFLDTNDASGTSTANWNNTSPTSSVFSVGATAATNGAYNYVAHCWAPVAGFSAFGSYTGNGSTDGPFIYTGFKPKFLMYKRTDSAGSWFMVDSTRNPSNTANYWLQANTSDTEQTDTAIDLNSNGFKVRTTGTGTNASGGSYIYAAFAENPFKYANAR